MGEEDRVKRLVTDETMASWGQQQWGQQQPVQPAQPTVDPNAYGQQQVLTTLCFVFFSYFEMLVLAPSSQLATLLVMLAPKLKMLFLLMLTMPRILPTLLSFSLPMLLAIRCN